MVLTHPRALWYAHYNLQIPEEIRSIQPCSSCRYVCAWSALTATHSLTFELTTRLFSNQFHDPVDRGENPKLRTPPKNSSLVDIRNFSPSSPWSQSPGWKRAGRRVTATLESSLHSCCVFWYSFLKLNCLLYEWFQRCSFNQEFGYTW